jgi:ubiquinone/menaquinone biosynthesis C-methylase UbiE
MNQKHLELCASDEWAEAIERWIIPATIRDAVLGDDVLEVGPGPGKTTDVLSRMVPRLTAVELNQDLAEQLADRFAGSSVDVIRGDATQLDLPDRRFSAVLSFTMLHHVPSQELQDRVFSEAFRVLRPGGLLIGCDTLDSDDFRALHVDDVCVPIDPDGLADRLSGVGFGDVAVERNEPYDVRFRAVKPPRDR